jgi:hypothetical protein
MTIKKLDLFSMHRLCELIYYLSQKRRAMCLFVGFEAKPLQTLHIILVIYQMTRQDTISRLFYLFDFLAPFQKNWKKRKRKKELEIDKILQYFQGQNGFNLHKNKILMNIID